MKDALFYTQKNTRARGPRATPYSAPEPNPTWIRMTPALTPLAPDKGYEALWMVETHGQLPPAWVADALREALQAELRSTAELGVLHPDTDDIVAMVVVRIHMNQLRPMQAFVAAQTGGPRLSASAGCPLQSFPVYATKRKQP